MLILHTFGPNLGMPDPSPFVLKVHTFLRMSGIEYEAKPGLGNISKAPKGKLPFITHDGKVIADSQFIFEYCNQVFGDKLDEHLSDEQKAIAYLITKSLDENLYFPLIYSRWVSDESWPTIKQAFFSKFPMPLRLIVPNIARKKAADSIYKQGTSRHSEEEIKNICRKSFQALSDLIGGKQYIFGEQPSSLDATTYAFLAEFILSDLDNSFNRVAKEYPVLVKYCERICSKYFSDHLAS